MSKTIVAKSKSRTRFGQFKTQDRMQQAQMLRKLRDDTFFKRLQLDNIKSQAQQLSGQQIGGKFLTGKERKKLEKHLVE